MVSAAAPVRFGVTPARLERDYLRVVEARGIASYLRNGRGLSMYFASIDGQAIPCIVSDGAPGNASFVAPRGHYFEYPIHEIGRASRWWTAGRLRQVLLPFDVAFRF